MSKKIPDKKSKQQTVLVPTAFEFGGRLSWIKNQIAAGHIVQLRFVLEADQNDFKEIQDRYKVKNFIRADGNEIIWIFGTPTKAAKSLGFPESIRIEFHAIGDREENAQLFAELMVARWLS